MGVMVNIDRGSIHFFKDGKDLGEAFVHKEIRKGTLYPFIQLQTNCKMSIFHPFVYPQYRAPDDGDRDNSPSIGQRIKEYIDYGLNKVVCGKNEEEMLKNRKSVSFDATVQEADALRKKEEEKRFKEERYMLERKQKLMDEMRQSHKVM